MEKMISKLIKFSVLISVVAFISCEQKKGERCQQNGDCESGLICCFSVGGVPGDDGICKPASECNQLDGTSDTVSETDEMDHFETEVLEGKSEMEEEATEGYFEDEMNEVTGEDLQVELAPREDI